MWSAWAEIDRTKPVSPEGSASDVGAVNRLSRVAPSGALKRGICYGSCDLHSPAQASVLGFDASVA